MHIRQLTYIIEVANCGSITLAAQKLYTSQPSLTKMIRNFEQQYDLRLFERTPRGVELTEEGEQFLYYAKNLVQSDRELEQILELRNWEKKCCLSIATLQLGFLHELLIELYKQFQNKQIHFNIEELNREKVVHAVLTHSVKFGISVRSQSDTKSFKAQYNENSALEIYVLSETTPEICVGPRSPFWGRTSITREEVRNSFCIVLDIEDSVRTSLNMGILDYDFNRNKILFTNNLTDCMEFVLHTDAVFYINSWHKEFFRGKPVQFIPIAESRTQKVPVNELVLLKCAGVPLNIAERAFCDMLFTHFGRPCPPELSGKREP